MVSIKRGVLYSNFFIKGDVFLGGVYINECLLKGCLQRVCLLQGCLSVILVTDTGLYVICIFIGVLIQVCLLKGMFIKGGILIKKNTYKLFNSQFSRNLQLIKYVSQIRVTAQKIIDTKLNWKLFYLSRDFSHFLTQNIFCNKAHISLFKKIIPYIADIFRVLYHVP